MGQQLLLLFSSCWWGEVEVFKTPLKGPRETSIHDATTTFSLTGICSLLSSPVSLPFQELYFQNQRLLCIFSGMLVFKKFCCSVCLEWSSTIDPTSCFSSYKKKRKRLQNSLSPTLALPSCPFSSFSFFFLIDIWQISTVSSNSFSALHHVLLTGWAAASSPVGGGVPPQFRFDQVIFHWISWNSEMETIDKGQ